MSRHHPGPAVNPLAPEPRSPGPWVDDRRCAVCGDLYADYRAGVDFSEAANELRHSAKEQGDLGGGYRSRGPVLWRMRCAKLAGWYLEHMPCGEGWDVLIPKPLDDPEREAERLPEVWELDGRYVVRGWWTEDDPGDPAWWAAALCVRATGGDPWPVFTQLHRHARRGADNQGEGGCWLRLVEEGAPTRGAFRVTVLELL